MAGTMSTPEKLESFQRAVTARLVGLKKQLPGVPTLRVTANLDTGKVTFELPGATSGLKMPRDLAEQLAKSFDKAGVSILNHKGKGVVVPQIAAGVDHLPMQVDVDKQRNVQVAFKERTAGIECEFWEAIQIAEVIRRAVKFIDKLERNRGRTLP